MPSYAARGCLGFGFVISQSQLACKAHFYQKIMFNTNHFCFIHFEV